MNNKKSLNNFSSLKINLASPAVIESWSHGEVLEPETINYRTLKPEKDGLFCERIFGPSNDYECSCGKYKGVRYKGIECDKCGVEVTRSNVRRQRMGHINLACPVAHIWFFKNIPSHISLLLGVSPRKLAGVIYFSKYLVVDIDQQKKEQTIKSLESQLEQKLIDLEEQNKQSQKNIKTLNKKEINSIKNKIKSPEQRKLAVSEAKLKLKRQTATLREIKVSEKEIIKNIFKKITKLAENTEKHTILTEEQYLQLVEYNADSFIQAEMGAEAILKAVKNIDLPKLAEELRQEIKKYSGQHQKKATKRLRIVEGFHNADIKPEWMVLRILPVLPPDLRPMVQLSGGRFASSDINDLYRRVINRNNRLKHLINLGAPKIILRNEKRMLQESVDTLLDTSKARTVRRRGSKELRSLADMLSGKQGRFRRNLLGKRVDYSGRSVIVVGPELKLNQCGLPKEMALEMFKPYVLRELISRGYAPNVKSAKYLLEKRPPEIFDILEDITKDHPVLLNRAPTLHKLGIQAFYPVLVEGEAIHLHPNICAGYNADFDGDQMAVHVPLSKQAQQESIDIMMPDSNLLKPANGAPVVVPNKEMALGIYYLTSIDQQLDECSTIFASFQEAIFAYQSNVVKLRQPISVNLSGDIINTTIGRLKFNEIFPDNTDFINHNIATLDLKKIVNQAIGSYSKQRIIQLIDDLKDLGFKSSTLSGVSVAVSDCKILPNKQDIIKKANKKASIIEDNYRNGLITKSEKKRLSNELWMDITENIANKTWQNFDESNAIKLIIKSGGTRASKDQVKQLAAMRGLLVDPLGNIIELPTKSNFREGLSIFEYVTSSRGSRKGLTDSAIKTADAGYLTRRLVDVSHDVIIREQDCGTDQFITINKQDGRSNKFTTRITSRFLANTIKHPDTDNIIAKKGDLITDELASTIDKAGITQVDVYSPLTCQSKQGLCSKCYGWDFSTKKEVTIGTPVGVLAAQSIGEPGTQLTMRVKHFGGIAVDDVTRGLPRIEELFETRHPKITSPLSEVNGTVLVKKTKRGYKFIVQPTDKNKNTYTYTAPLTATPKIESGDQVKKGQRLSTGSLDIEGIVKARGLINAQEYLIKEAQKVYESQGIPIHDKHFETIIRKMSDKVKIKKVGDTHLLAGEFIEKTLFDQANEQLDLRKHTKAQAQRTVLGITKSSLHTESWLSSASFQNTSSILTKAASFGKVDKLIGLKENVIIGRLIPTSKERAKI